MTPFARTRVLPLAGVALGLAVAAAISMVVLPRASEGSGGVGGPFELHSSDGGVVTQAALTGHPTLVFFGYTHCPDVCPTTLAQISGMLKVLGPQDPTRALFVTVDPQRDTAPVLKDYLQSFSPRITGLTGTPEEVRQIEADYKVYAKVVPDKDGGYAMDHTAMTYLMDKHGRFVGGFNTDQSAAAGAAELKSYE